MSRIYFHSEHGTAELRGSERAYMGTFCGDLLIVALGMGRVWPSDADRYRALVPANHYALAETDPMRFIRSLETWLHVGQGQIGRTLKVEAWVAGLNTALAMGSDPIRLMARLHGQCETHAYVEGTNRAWLADIIEDGRDAHILRANQGWESVVELLRARDDEPVVTSYSVCEQFPNPGITGVHGEAERDQFYERPHNEQWRAALVGLRAREPEDGLGYELKPDGWESYIFDNGVNGFMLLDELRDAPPKEDEANSSPSSSRGDR